MLTHALETPKTIHVCPVVTAEASRDYFGPECREPFRKRQGQKQAHFYHYQGSLCKWAGVGWPHLKTQRELAKQFQGLLEQPFRSIARIADVYVPSQGLVIEVQYSPIRLDEVLQRQRDYQSIGLCVLWILQKGHPLAPEYGPGGALFAFPHYFCDMEKEPFCLFDLLETNILPLTNPAIRKYTTNRHLSLNRFPQNEPLAHLLWQRYQLWSCGLTGDFLERILKTKRDV
jgi:hypothetical protein